MSKKRGNGEGSIFYDEKKKLYRGQVVIGYDDETGKRKRKSVSGKNKTEVLQKMKQLELQVFNGDFVDESSITIYNLAKQIIEDKYNMNYINKNTYLTHMQTLNRLKPIYHTPLQQANETQLRNYFQNTLDYSTSIIRKNYELLKLTFKEAEKRNIITRSPMLNINMPKSRQKQEKVRALTIDEQNKLIKVLQSEDIKYSQQMLLSMLTGMRMGEINALTLNDINLNFNFISIDKTISREEKGKAVLGDTAKTDAGTRSIPITDDIKPLIKECMKLKENMLFVTETGKLITTNQVNMELRRTLEKYDIIDNSIKGKVTCHSLRHTYATRCIEGGMPAKVLQKLLGHTDIRITLNTYCDAFEQFESVNIAKVNEYMRQQGLTLNAAAG
ncbi:MAG: site-specific integrase [Eubacterium sp.]|nr:site-specific integrase [Eubacterium sp.]